MNIRRPIALVTTTAAVAATISTAGLLATGPAHGATITRCKATSLSLHLGPPTGAAGTTYYHLRFTNEGTAPCSLYGYPGARAYTSPAGEGIGNPASRDVTYPAALVVLAPGGKAHAVLGIAEAGNYDPARCQPRAAGAVGVYPPGAFRRVAVRLGFEACAGRTVHLLTVTPVAAGG